MSRSAMFGKCLICFVIICAVMCCVKAAGKASSNPQELNCLNYGGTCVRKGDCPEKNLARKEGLCPSGPKHPLECCHGLPISATGCRAQGGECMKTSYFCSTLTRADDCAEEEHCCILVH